MLMSIRTLFSILPLLTFCIFVTPKNLGKQEDPDEKTPDAAFHPGQNCLLR